MTKILAFDTATSACSAALWLDGEVFESFEVAPRRHGELLLPMIDQLLEENKVRLKDCDAIAFGQGPGSFMGLRIAAGLAQGLAWGAKLPVIPISSLQALAQAAYWKKPCSHILAGWDARMNQIYWGVYRAENDRMQSLIPDQLSSPSTIHIPVKDCLAAGNAWEIYADGLSEKIMDLLWLGEECYPTAKAMAFLAVPIFEKGEVLMPQDIELTYLRNEVADKRA